MRRRRWWSKMLATYYSIALFLYVVFVLLVNLLFWLRVLDFLWTCLFFSKSVPADLGWLLHNRPAHSPHPSHTILGDMEDEVSMQNTPSLECVTAGLSPFRGRESTRSTHFGVGEWHHVLEKCQGTFTSTHWAHVQCLGWKGLNLLHQVADYNERWQKVVISIIHHHHHHLL